MRRFTINLRREVGLQTDRDNRELNRTRPCFTRTPPKLFYLDYCFQE